MDGGPHRSRAAVLVYGSMGPDLVYHVPRLPGPGDDVPARPAGLYPAGAAGNAAAALAAWGMTVTAYGNELGDDPLGRWMLEELAARGIECGDGLLRRGAPTPTCTVLITPDRERTVIGCDYVEVRWRPVAATVWQGVDGLLVDGYSGEAGEAVAAAAAGRGLPVVAVDTEGPGARLADIVVWSKRDHPDPAAAASLAAVGPTVVVTDGPGPVVAYGAGRPVEVHPARVPAGDPTGAGEVLAAACLAGICEGLALEPNLARAVAVAGRFVVGGRSAGIPPLAARGEGDVVEGSQGLHLPQGGVP